MLPILYQNADFILYSYPLLMGLGWGTAYQIFFSYLNPAWPRWKGQLLFWGIFFSAWIGAKLLFYVTYPEGGDFLMDPVFWTGGGFVFYGGFLGGAVFLGLFRGFDKSLRPVLLWPMLPAIAFGHGIGRLGCFLAGCCFGKPTDSIWGIYLHGHYRHPTQLLEAIGLIALGAYLLKSKAPRRELFAVYLLVYGVLRFGIEMLRGDQVRGEWGVLTPSQWISIILILSGACVMYWSRRRTSKPF